MPEPTEAALPGERYEAVVPDALDLAQRAELAMEASMLSRVTPDGL
jgi:hypothetical protein